MHHAIPVAHLEGEEEYFHKLDAELIQEMRQRASAEEEHRQIAEILHTEDPKLIGLVEKLGYTHATIILVSLVPLIEMAWSDGSITPIERDRILAAARERGIEENTPAYERLTAWLEQCPSPEFFRISWRAIKAGLASLSPGEREVHENALIRDCREFASATCEHFGWASYICSAKRKLLRELDAELVDARVEGRR